jgi:ATP-dependent Lhr-like helicase
MALVDLVVQVEAPGSVASGLQRIGRAGHQVGAVSRGIMFPKYRGDLVECAVIVERMKSGAIEALEIPRNPLDVLAQQIVAMVALDDWDLEELAALVRRSAPFAALPDGALEATLDMLSGRYPSHEFATLRPRLNWDRGTGTLSARSGSQSLAITSGGTIPDRGLFGVFLAGGERARVGELDEEMVYESRPGDVFVLGASSWLIEDITHDRVLVTPAPGQPGRMPFWHGDAPGRPVELGRALGRFVREIGDLAPEDRGLRLKSMGLDDFAAANLIAYLDEQRAATGAVPDDRTIVVERFRDELGDWRVCVHSCFGARVNAPWAQAIEANLGARLGLEVQSIHTDDGIAVRIPEADEAPPADSIVLDPEAVDDLVVTRVGESALFASRFRECAARALLLPRRRPGSRTPLWQQRQRSAQLLQVARRHHNFPMILETYRECLQDVFDLPALVELMAAIRRREVSVVEVETPAPSPFASSLQFGYVNAFMYEGDAPLAERRAQALSLDRSLLAEIMGHEELRDLIDRNALAELELELQWLTDDRKARAPDGLHDALRVVGDLTEPEIAARSSNPGSASGWVRALVDSRRALEIRVAGEPRVIAIEDAAVYRDALGVALPVGLPDAFAIGPDDPLGALLGRYAATHGPFVADDPAARFGLGVAVVERALGNLEPSGSIVRGEFRPDGTRREWIDAGVLRRVRRRSLAAWRKEIEPASQDALARFALAWHGVAPRKSRAASLADLYEVVEGLQGVPLAASTLETQVLPARLPGYDPALLDQLGASGEVVWAGCGPLGRDDGWIALSLADRAATTLPEILPLGLSPLAGRVEELLEASGALFFRAIAQEVSSTDDGELLNALWELVWCGRVTNDTLAPVRAFVSGGARIRTRPTARSRRPHFPSRLGPPAGAGRWSPAPPREPDATRRLHAAAEQLLARHGLLVRGALDVERMPGGFAGVYPVLKAMEEAGRCRRGYFVDGLGGAQFALPGAVDRMRSLLEPSSGPAAVVLAATDPANPYGAALSWPERSGGGHRPGRKVGATVVLVAGAPVLYLEKGGRSLLTFTDDRPVLAVAVDALAEVARSGALGRLAVERADGASVHEGSLGELLAGAGFRFTSRGLALGA